MKVNVKANSYLHELSFLPEIVGIGTQVDSQMLYLFPGETHTFTVTGPAELLREIETRAADLLWSHNRVVNS